MLRIAVCLLFLFLFSACNKNWRGLVIQKRVYMEGYYVHLPWKRKAPVNAYPKPEPFPVDRSRTAAVDSGSGSPAPVPPAATGGSGPVPTNATTAGTALPATTTAPPNTSGGTAVAPPDTATATATETATDTDIATDPNLPGTDTVAVADEPPQRDKDFEFPDGEFALTAELGFFGPAAKSGYEVKAKSFSTGGGLRYTVRAFPRHHISGDAGVHMSLFHIRQDQRKQKPLFTEPHGEERMMMMKMRFMLTDRILITRNAAARFDQVEIGMFSEINLFTTHVAIDQHGNDQAAMMTRHKTRLFGLHYLRRFQCGATLRIANEKLAVFVNYRINKLVKGDGDLPKILFGVELRVGS